MNIVVIASTKDANIIICNKNPMISFVLAKQTSDNDNLLTINVPTPIQIQGK